MVRRTAARGARDVLDEGCGISWPAWHRIAQGSWTLGGAPARTPQVGPVTLSWPSLGHVTGPDRVPPPTCAARAPAADEGTA
ncbi:hypothetical protein [Nocardiopsis prasina]|uniref:hypothetical protein n=1 Tax=Nocardiopsis prasina TaxID=2015 RepID=UPI0009FF3B34|nr:hypothetical protein [Nocardiopsis prasina]